MSSDSGDNTGGVRAEESCSPVCSPRYVYGSDADEAVADNGCAACSSPPPEPEMKPTFVITHFQDGPLGVNLHRRPQDGIVEISGISPNTQATQLDVQVGDELWSVGSIEMGTSFIEKEAWQGIVDYIKQSSRPLEVVWKRNPASQSHHLVARPPSRPSSRPSSPPVEQGVRAISNDAMESQSHQSPCTESRDAATAHPSEAGGEGTEDQQNEPEEPEPTVSPTYRALEAVLSTLVKKPTHGKDNYKLDNHYHYLLHEDRRLLRRGDLTTPGATTLWMKTYQKKHLILLSDLLIITTPQVVHKTQCYVVEHVIDLQTCKLRSQGQVFGGALDGKGGPANPTQTSTQTKDKPQSSEKQQLECAFQVIYPGGSLQLFADSRESKEVWVLNLFLAICARVGGENHGRGQVLGWRHQYMLGTMHAAVLSHDEAHVRELVAMCDAGDMEFSACIDASDEDGYTPLHYACIMRMHGIIRALHEAAADVTAADHRGLTPLHWAAMQLDDYTLSLLCSHVFDLDLCDRQQRTPLYMACVEGRDVGGYTDNAALKKCVACMLTHQPNVNFFDQHGLTMAHYLAASWQYEALELLLLADADANARGARSGMTPLHYACLAQPIKLAEGEAKRIMQGSDNTTSSNGGNSAAKASEADDQGAGQGPVYEKLNHPMGSTTLRTLLKAGARPNMRDSQGRTALHILAEPGRDDLWDLMELTDGVAVLVSFGARFDDSPALQALKGRLIGTNVEALVERWQSLPVINGDALNLTLNHFKRTNTAGSTSESTSTKLARNQSAENMTAGMITRGLFSSTSSNTLSPRVTAAASGDSGGPASAGASVSTRGATTAPSVGYPAPVFPESPDRCSLCWFQFSLFRRPHHCRLCDALCCDECSKKRVLIEYQQARACDGCYNRVMDLQEKKNRDDMAAKMKPIPKSNSDASKLYLAERAKLMAEASAASAGAEEGKREKGNTAQTMNALNETREALHQRGEKLSKLSDRTDAMANQANEFAKMAKLLNEQQKSRWF